MPRTITQTHARHQEALQALRRTIKTLGVMSQGRDGRQASTSLENVA